MKRRPFARFLARFPSTPWVLTGCLLLIVIMGIYNIYLFPPVLGPDVEQAPFYEESSEYILDPEGKQLGFNLFDPNQAPEDKRELVLLGFHIFNETQTYAADYVGNKLNCCNCHFRGGNTTGGKGGGISLLGVTATYPRYSERDARTIDLAFRIDNCFRRSMNGKAPAKDSREMQALLAYLDWISEAVVHLPIKPWLGLKTLTVKHNPNAKKGKEVYHMHCALCHGGDGEGSEGVPPLWGPGAFNDGAGMNTISKLAAFAYSNMPYEEPVLTEEAALDVAAYISSQKRPRFIKAEPPANHPSDSKKGAPHENQR